MTDTDEITRLRAENERLRAENFSLAAWQCEFTDGKTGLVAHEHGGTYCAMAKENERQAAELRSLRAALKPFVCDCEGEAICIGECMHRNARAALDGQPVPGKEEA